MFSYLKTGLVSAAMVLGFTGTAMANDAAHPHPEHPHEDGLGGQDGSTSLKPLDLSANDVSILFPAPNNSVDIENNVIRLTDFAPGRVFPQDRFSQIMRLVTGPTSVPTPGGGTATVDAGAIPGTNTRIRFPGTNQARDWALAGIRIDPGAPGLSQEVFDVFGKSPQIRLIMQPIRDRGFDVEVTDGSLHLVFAFHGPKDTSNACQLHNTPDMAAFEAAVNDLVDIKQHFEDNHGVVTDGTPMGIHPAFRSNGSEFRDAIKGYLDTHLPADSLFAVSIAAIPLPAPEPWVFVAMQQIPGTSLIVPVPSPATVQPDARPVFGQMINFAGGRRIQPSPATRNLLPVDCQMNQVGQVPSQVQGAGVSTATAFDDFDQDITNISAVIADPARSHFFNTDCASCHTETRKPIDMGRATAASIGAEAGIDPNVIPKEQWNVRAFGWFPGFFQQVATGAHETVTRRAATETHEVLECFESGRWHLPDEACLP